MRDEQRACKRGDGSRQQRDADRQQRQILEHVTPDRGEPRRLQEPQRRKWKALRAALDQEVNQDRRGGRREHEQGGRIQPEHGRLTACARGGNCGARDPAVCP